MQRGCDLAVLILSLDLIGLVTAAVAARLWYHSGRRGLRRISRFEELDAEDLNRIVTAFNRSATLKGIIPVTHQSQYLVSSLPDQRQGPKISWPCLIDPSNAPPTTSLSPRARRSRRRKPRTSRFLSACASPAVFAAFHAVPPRLPGSASGGRTRKKPGWRRSADVADTGSNHLCAECELTEINLNA